MFVINCFLRKAFQFLPQIIFQRWRSIGLFQSADHDTLHQRIPTHTPRQARQSVFISSTIDTTGCCKTHPTEKREAISVLVPGNVKQEQEKNRKNKLDTYKYSKCVKCVLSFPSLIFNHLMFNEIHPTRYRSQGPNLFHHKCDFAPVKIKKGNRRYNLFYTKFHNVSQNL